ncbi:MAG: hypothetical protein AAF799_36860 [Myxococcota bacterium]
MTLRIRHSSLVVLASFLLACRTEQSAAGDSTAAESSGQPLPGPGTSGGPSSTPAGTSGEDTGLGPEDSGDSSGGAAFLSEPDGGGTCVVSDDGTWHCSACDVVLQDCPAGEKCMPWANDGGGVWNATRCSPIAPDPVGPGESCTVEGSATSGFDDCDLDSMCWGVDPDTLIGTCAPFCDPMQPQEHCSEAETCVEANDGVISLCLSRCDPLQPDTCTEGETCTIVGGDPVCVPSFNGGGQTCGETRCDPGQLCAPADVVAECDDTYCCTPWCDLDAAEPDLACPVRGELCQPYYPDGDAPAGFEHVGYCGVPM